MVLHQKHFFFLSLFGFSAKNQNFPWFFLFLRKTMENPKKIKDNFGFWWKTNFYLQKSRKPKKTKKSRKTKKPKRMTSVMDSVCFFCFLGFLKFSLFLKNQNWRTKSQKQKNKIVLESFWFFQTNNGKTKQTEGTFWFLMKNQLLPAKIKNTKKNKKTQGKPKNQNFWLQSGILFFVFFCFLVFGCIPPILCF